jgi:sensor histidine kinase YesM
MLFILQPVSRNIPLTTRFWIIQGLIFCWYIGLYYLNAFVWVPRFLFKSKIRSFILLAITTGVLVLFMIRSVGWGLNQMDWMSGVIAQDHSFHAGAGEQVFGELYFAGMVFLVLLISTSLACVQAGQRETLFRQHLEMQHLSSELAFLKTQINPHLFFNTLNNIYSLTLSNVDLARESVYTLARMMHYVLHETENGKTYLSKEIDFIQDYIDLMKIQHTGKVQIIFEKPDSLQEATIAPMLLSPLVENAFKHGVDNTLPSHIYIGIKQGRGMLEVAIRNTLLPLKKNIPRSNSGQGLLNTRRRLELLYPCRFQLAVTEQTPEHEFAVHLTLKLA